MTEVTIQIPDGLQGFIQRQIDEGRLGTVGDYCISLIARDAQNAKFDDLIEEAETDFEQGRCRPHTKGDLMKWGEEIIRRHLEAKSR